MKISMRKLSPYTPLRQIPAFAAVLLIALSCSGAFAQSGTAPSANCHVSDGHFTSCPGGGSEWLDVQPVFFPASNSYLYVNQDPGRQFIWLLYDFPFQQNAHSSDGCGTNQL